ncbi:MAG TPA: ankyrin repeat domain-containing protein [Labilithrix sp.]|nr:ankyrin repeat domain-containing protein [Labilithrix sp.]
MTSTVRLLVASVLSMLLVIGCTRPTEAIHKAAAEGDAERVESLLAKDPKLATHRSPRFGRTPLHEAKTRQVAELLLKAGAQIDEQDTWGRQPIHVAKSGAVVELLLERGVRFDLGFGPEARSALHSAESGEAVTALIAAGLSPEVLDNRKLPPIFAQAESDGPWVKDTIPALVSAGASVDARDWKGRTPLFFATGPAVVALVAAGADVEARDKVGMTPLHQASFDNELKRAEALLAAGASVSARLPSNVVIETRTFGAERGFTADAGNATPLRLAATKEMASLLRKHGATE